MVNEQIKQDENSYHKCRNSRPFGNVTWEDTGNLIYLIGEPLEFILSDEEIVSINIGGELFQTFRKTLDRFPDTLLGNDKLREEYYNEFTGQYFFDRHSEAFECILYYYQSGGEIYAPYELALESFIEELVFFRIGESVIERLEVETGVREPFAPQILPHFYPMKVLWMILEYPSSSKIGQIFAYSTVTVIMLSIVMFVLETLPEFSRTFIAVDCESKGYEDVCSKSGGFIIVPSKHDWWMNNVNTGVIVWFTLEFLLRLFSCPHKTAFFCKGANIIDLVSILPYYLGLLFQSSDRRVLGVIRVFRVLRVLKLSRYSRGLQVLAKTLVAAYEELAMLVFMLLVSVLTFSSVMYFAEYRLHKTEFKSIPHALWWAIVTVTTVGYGDVTPVSLVGKLIACLAATFSVVVMALPIPSVVSHFAQFYKMEKNRTRCEEAKKARYEIIKRQREEEKSRNKNIWI